MAWDTERTKRLLREAATAEFSEFGLAGGRVDRIAEAAGINKQRIYSYFGSKSGLFDEVISAEMARIMEEIPIEGHGTSAVLNYAARMFDHHTTDPTLARLLFWEGLENRTATVSEKRAALNKAKVEHLSTVLAPISRSDAAQLLLTIIVLSCAQPILHNVSTLLGASVPGQLEQRRAEVLRTVELLTEEVQARSLID